MDLNFYGLEHRVELDGCADGVLSWFKNADIFRFYSGRIGAAAAPVCLFNFSSRLVTLRRRFAASIFLCLEYL